MIAAIFLTTTVLVALLVVKLYVTNKHYDRAIDYIFKQDNSVYLISYYLNTDKMLYDVIDLRKWTYEQMFPGLEK